MLGSGDSKEGLQLQEEVAWEEGERGLVTTQRGASGPSYVRWYML